MVSKCANPACFERFLYLHQGKIFHLTPTPELEVVGEGFAPSLYERFWLCDKCCRQMTLVWGGTAARLVPLPVKPVAPLPHDPVKDAEEGWPEKPRRAAPAGLQRR